ncbi:restriction endonuclease [Pedobacter frigoris]|uniref:restriction endonuclease n=1 Tax=Pedobacter frigoris TaxID=2571272 RepID=UPI0029304B60|nr:restriction endonuclease [Pedobacter frigoris]
MRYTQISGHIPAIYRPIPSQESELVTLPRQEAIMSYLSQIPHHAFTEFVKDILTIIEGHTLVNITDGSGDEKQDLLTIDSKGNKCLIQCKHTSDNRSRYNGDELDLVFAATIRKNCKRAIFVTNGDLTTQAKRYINDQEYLRGWPKKSPRLEIDYINNYRIWEKISSSSEILNKWFGGLGQTHGLRTFRFEISIFLLPFKAEQNQHILENLIRHLIDKALIHENTEEKTYEGRLGDEIEFKISHSLQFERNIDINYFSPDKDPNYSSPPLSALAIAVTVLNDKPFDVNLIRKNIIVQLLRNNLPVIPKGNWWHILTGRSTTFVFLHDLSQAKLISLDTAQTFVSDLGEIYSEKEYCSLEGEGFESGKEEESEGMLIHAESGCSLIPYYTQEIGLEDEYNTKGVKYAQFSALKSYIFKVAKNLNTHSIQLAANTLPQSWFAFFRNNELVVCYSKEEKKSDITLVKQKLSDLKIELLTVKQSEKNKILTQIDLYKTNYITTHRIDQLRYPVDLKERMFWIAKDFKFEKKAEIQFISELFAYKYRYECQWGRCDTLEKNYSYPELTNLLFQPSTMRAQRSLDINIWNNPIWVVMRFYEQETSSSREIATAAIKEFEIIFEHIQSIITKNAI